MFHTKDHKTGYLFDQGPFGWLGPRRKRLIDTSWAKLFREKILPSLPVNTLMQHYHLSQGAPTKELYTMLGVMVLQQMFDLTDEETVSQYAFNIQWHYALDITGESDAVAYLSPKTLWNMRKLFCENDLYKDIFDSSAAILATAFAVDTSRQRIDSVPIFSNMRHLGRIGLFVATIKKFLVNLTRHHRVIFDSLEKERTDRYLSKKEASVFSMVKPSESAHTLETLGKDLFFFVERFKGNTGVTSMSSYTLLVRLLQEQCVVDGSVKPNKDVPSDSLQNPSDPDASYDGHKGKGYQTQVMETYSPDKDSLSLITHVVTEPAHTSDASALIPAITATKKRQLKPEEVLADSLYGGDANCEKAKEQGVRVLSPVMGKESTKGITLTDFGVSGATVIACPEGNVPVFTKHKKDRYLAAFDPETCGACPHRNTCPAKPGKKGTYLRYDEKTLRIAQRRAYQKTAEFSEKYRYRSGIEGTMSFCDRKTGIKQLRVRGLTPVSFCAALKAAAVNIFRATAFQNRKDRDQKTETMATNRVPGSMYGALARFIRRIRLIAVNNYYPGTYEPPAMAAMAA